MNVEEYNKTLETIRGLPGPRIYHNSTPVATVDGTPLSVWETVSAATYLGLNTLLMGERGDGKTQLENELRSCLFDGKATYLRMKDNLRASDIYEAFDLAKLRGSQGTTADARQLTMAVHNGLTVIDEINRAHEKVQNQVFGICDGYIEFNGPKGSERMPLGFDLGDHRRYHIAIASANIGNERYHGVSPIDPALLDRFHLIVNTDNCTPSSLDLAIIGMDDHGPKIVDFEDEDHTKELTDIVKSATQIGLSVDARIAQIYLQKGFDYCIRSDNKSKRSVLGALPKICAGCHYLGDGCGYTLPISTRSFKAIGSLARGLKLVTDAKSGFEAKDQNDTRANYEHVLAAFELVAPYGGIFDQAWLDEHYKGSPHFAMGDVGKNLRKALTEKQEAIGTAFGEAISGKLSEKSLKPFDHRWAWFRTVLESLNAGASKYGDLTQADLDKVSKEFPIVQWLR